MTVQILRGDARNLGLADASVDLIVTSPPYWSLRSYQDGGQHYDGQIGDEGTPADFVDALVECTREWMRVLKPAGSMWVNLGDKYNAYNGGRGDGTIQKNDVRQSPARGHGLDVKHVRPKSLIGIPWRYAIRCIDDLGLILRAEVIWAKPNGLPESVTDRVRRSHEQWFHFTREPRYFSAVDEIREAHTMKPQRRTSEWVDDVVRPAGTRTMQGLKTQRDEASVGGNPLGKLPGSVWTIPTEPLHVPESLGIDHFAAFPTEWPRRIIQGWSPSGICTVCGEGRRPVVEKGEPVWDGRSARTGPTQHSPEHNHGTGASSLRMMRDLTLTGEACACPEPTAPTRPAVVLDPFGGTGTTALVANALGRHGISNDMSADYCRLAGWRTSDPKQIAKAARREYKPSAEKIDGQLDLLEGLGA